MYLMGSMIFESTLTLLVTRFRANNTNYAMTLNHFAIAANPLN
jgi:hypothetical protein